MHETVTGVDQQLLSLHSLPLCTLFHSCLRKKKKKKHLEDCVSLMLAELKVEVTALQKQELSRCFVYIKQISVNNAAACTQREDAVHSFRGKLIYYTQVGES